MLRRLRHALLSCCSMPALQAFWTHDLPDRRLRVPRDHEVVALWPGRIRVVPVRPFSLQHWQRTREQLGIARARAAAIAAGHVTRENVLDNLFTPAQLVDLGFDLNAVTGDWWKVQRP